MSSRTRSLVSVVWLLTRAQLAYRKSTIVVVLLIELAALATLLWLSAPQDETQNIAATMTLVFGAGLGAFGWGVDTFERRIRMLVTLPVSRTAVGASRVLGVVVMQLLVSCLAWLLIQLARLSEGFALEEAYLFTLTAAWALSFVIATFVFEEINVATNHNRVVLYCLNGLFAAVIFFVAFFVQEPESLVADAGLLVAVPLASALAVAEVLLFRERKTFDVGVSPWHGLPTDWSKG